MSQNIYRKLQVRLDQYSIGFPATQSGIELKILRKLFDEDDATLFMALGLELESPNEIASSVGRDLGQVQKHLQSMDDRGLLFSLKVDGVRKYGATPFIHGIFEFQLDRMDAELARLIESYFEEAYYAAMGKGAAAFVRTVPVQQSLETTHSVAAYEDAVRILKKKNLIVVAECICQKQKNMANGNCDQPKNVCFLFDLMGQYYLDHNLGIHVDADEAVKILAQAQKAGLVTQFATSEDPGAMCNCCGNCCGVLRSLKTLAKPAENVFSNHFAGVDFDLCTGCETCFQWCPMSAIALNKDVRAEINLDRCIGCGLCVINCPEEAIKLNVKPKNELRNLPANNNERMEFMARLRNLI
jgi:Na+-translocating ferredoxin:NAD+ oxidoreductase subunit B